MLMLAINLLILVFLVTDMPVRNKRSKHQRPVKGLRISSAEIEKNNIRVRSEREKTQEEERKRLESREKEKLRLEEKPAKKPRAYDLKKPAFVRPVEGLPYSLESYFRHKFKDVTPVLGVLAIFAGEPKKPTTHGQISEARIIEEFNVLCLTGKLPKNLVDEFGGVSAKKQTELLNGFSPRPKVFALNLGVRLNDTDLEIGELNAEMADSEPITIGGAHDLEGYPIGPPRQKRAAEPRSMGGFGGFY